MKVILIQDIDELGKAGDIVTVKDGYSRNFLIPKKLAVSATPGNVKVIELKKKAKEARERAERKVAEALKKKLESISCTIPMQAGEDDRLFGSVTSTDIAKALEVEGIQIDKRKIEIPDPINKIGVYNVLVKLGPQISQKVKVWVVKE